MITIKVQKLYKKYNVELFNGLSFSASASSPLVITGRNGSGKSTLLNIICGFKSSNSGKVEFYQKKEKLNLPIIREHIAFVSSDVNPYDCFKISECIKFASGGSKSFVKKALFICKEFSIHQDEIYGNLSNGMKQKFKISIALAKDPDILLLDEPFSDLDKMGRKYLNLFIKQSNSTIILATNDTKRLSFKYKEVCLDK